MRLDSEVKQSRGVLDFLIYFPLSCLAVVVFMLCAQSFSPAALASTAPSHQLLSGKNALILVSSGYGLPGVDLYVSTLVKNLTGNGFLLNDIHVEFLDLNRHSEKDDRQRMVSAMQDKYADIKIDLLFCVMQPALNFLLRDIVSLAPQVPVLCSFATMPDGFDFGQRQFVFQTMNWDFSGTMKIALELFPSTERVFVIQGNSEIERANRDIKRLQMEPWEGKVQIEDTQDLSIDEIEAKFASAPKNTIIIGAGVIQDAEGRISVPDEFMRRMVKTANAPIFVLTNNNIGYGTIGGSVSRFDKEALALSAMGVDILRGAIQLRQHITTVSGPKVPTFDWQQLQRWGANVESLPPETILINRPLTLWGQYEVEVITLIFLFLVLVAFACVMVLMNRRQKLSNIELELSRKEYLNLVESTPDLIIRFDDKGRILFVNNAALEIFGIPIEESIGRLTFDFVHPDDIVATRSAFKELFKSDGEVVTHENRLVSKQGMVHYMTWVTRAEYDETGQIEGFASTARNITERKRAEEEVKSARNFLDTVFEMSPIAMWISDREGTIIRTNNALRKILNLSDDRLVGKYNIFQDKNIEIQGAMHKVEAVFEEHIPSHFNMSWETSSIGDIDLQGASNLYIEVTLFPILSPTGEFTSAVCQWHDITERKQAERNLKDNVSFLQTLIETIPIPLFYKDTKGRYLSVNRAFEEFFGKSRDELIGKTVYDIGPKNIVDTYYEKDQQLFLNLGRQVYESTVLNGAGETRDVIFNKASYTDRDGNIKGIIGTVFDITERKQAEKERRTLTSQLQQAQKIESIGNLAGGIAHDFNNLLSPIVGFAELLREKLPQGSAEREEANEILKAGTRAAALVNQILMFSRRSEHKLQPIHVQKIIAEVLGLTRSGIPSNIVIDENLQDNCGLVMADVTHVHQIVMNLITNAYHAMEGKGGKISVTLKETLLKGVDEANSPLLPGHYAVLSVADEGCGITPNIMAKIFEPYFTTKIDGKGTGLGLAVVYGIVRACKGDIQVFSEIGKGTTFNVYLPLMKQAPDIDGENHPIDIQRGTEKILIVDDEVALLKLEKRTLQGLGYSVTECLSSVDAYHMFRANPEAFDLVLTDMTMPNMTGDELAQKMISIRSNIPVIICTGYSERMNEEKAKLIGIKTVLKKPVVKTDLAKSVRKFLDEAKSSSVVPVANRNTSS